MSTNFPTSLQDLDASRGTSGDPLSAPDHVTHHTTEDDTIEALQTKVGIDSSADTSSLDYKVKNTSSIDPGHKHTPTNSLVITGTPDGTLFLRDDDTWAAPPTVANASTTVKGSAEEATQAEIDADTAAGGTSARLFTNPSTLATSKYGTRLPTANEKSALAGTGTPNGTNKYVTNDDVSDAAASGKVVRAIGTALPALDASNLTGIKGQFSTKLTDNTNGTTGHVSFHTYLDMADSTNTGAYGVLSIPAGVTITSIEFIFGAGNTTDNLVFDYNFADFADGTATTDTSTGNVVTDKSTLDTPVIATIPAAAYNALTIGRPWSVEVIRKGSDASDTAVTTIKAMGIVVKYTT